MEGGGVGAARRRARGLRAVGLEAEMLGRRGPRGWVGRLEWL